VPRAEEPSPPADGVALVIRARMLLIPACALPVVPDPVSVLDGPVAGIWIATSPGSLVRVARG
jgi:hypothetical protein